MSTRVYVTGVGLLSPIGNTMSDFTESLRAGSSGFRAIPYFDTAAFPFDRGAVITEFPAELTTLVAEHPEWETAEHYGVHCAAVALADAGFAVEALDPFRTAVVVASSNARAFRRSRVRLIRAGRWVMRSGWHRMPPARRRHPARCRSRSSRARRPPGRALAPRRPHPGSRTVDA